MNFEQAEILGLRALTHMLSQQEIMTAYLCLTGITIERLKNSAEDPEILGSVLDYLLQNEPQLLTFCHAGNIAPEDIAMARRQLPGGEVIPDNL